MSSKKPKLPSSLTNKRLTSKDEATKLIKSTSEENKPSKSNKEKGGANSKGRVKITTMIDVALRDVLKILAIKQGVQFADLMNEALSQYIKKGNED